MSTDFDLDIVADYFDLTLSELLALEPDIQPYENDEGVLYGYNVYFNKDADPAILGKIKGLVNGEWVRVGPNAFDPD